MSIPSGIAIYFIIWWVCLFVVLPWGVRNPHEAGEQVEQGNEAGAPVNPMLWRKVLVTTIVASLVFLVVWGQITRGWISFDDIPFLDNIPAPADQ
jgi:predicted secreted protein